MAESPGNSLEACIRAWRNRRPFANGVSSEELADGRFTRGDLEGAAVAYAACELQTARISAKRGWCLAILGHCEEAAKFLTTDNCGASSAALAALAATIAGDWSRGKLYGAPGESAEIIKARREQVESLVVRALDTDEPDELAFLAYMDLVEWWRDREAALVVAERAMSRYQRADIIEWYVRLLRMLERSSDDAFNILLSRVPDEPWVTYVQEMFESALALSRYEDASEALDLLEQKLRPSDERLFDACLALLRAYVYLRRAQDADPGSARRGLATARALHEQLVGADDARALLPFVAKLRLALALVVSDESDIKEGARSVLDASWSESTAPDYPVSCELIVVGGMHFGAEFGDELCSGEVLAALSPLEQIRWKLLFGLSSLRDDQNPAGELLDLILQHGLQYAPAWAAQTVASVQLSCNTPNPNKGGRAVARTCVYLEKAFDKYAGPPGLDYSDLAVSQFPDLVDGVAEELCEIVNPSAKLVELLLSELGPTLIDRKAHAALLKLVTLVRKWQPDEQDAIFYEAFARYELKELDAARSLYERLLELNSEYRSAYWNLTLIYQALGNVASIEKLLPAVASRADSGEKSWIETRDRIKDAIPRARKNSAARDFPSFVKRELAVFPPLITSAVTASNLSLLEAASLLALMRASDLDHITLTVAPFGSSKEPFEPTHRFRRALLDLAMKGVIAVAESTPIDAFVESGGELRYHTDRVHWRINPLTLALESEIRGMSRARWPAQWTAHAEALSRDLATEECIAYMEYLAEERGLQPPDETDARAVFRELLEHCSVSKCWYYIEYGIKSTNDTRTKYPIARDQIPAMMLKRARQIAERALENGWETSRNRVQALPRSHLSAALHDVLTGWRERAFEEPIRTLVQSDWNKVRPAV